MDPLTPEQIGSPVPDVAPDSSTGEGVREGVAPGSGEQPPPLADGTSPDKSVPYSRLAEEVEARRALEQELQTLRGVVSEDPEFMNRMAAKYGASGIGVPTPPEPETTPPPQTPAEPLDPETDPEAWLKRSVKSVLSEELAPVKEFMAAQQQETQIEKAQRVYSEFKTANPNYDESRDSMTVVNILRNRRASTWGDAWIIAQHERGSAPAPATHLGDVHTAPPATQTDKDALRQKLADPNLSPWDREQLAQVLLSQE